MHGQQKFSENAFSQARNSISFYATATATTTEQHNNKHNNNKDEKNNNNNNKINNNSKISNDSNNNWHKLFNAPTVALKFDCFN